MMKSIEINFSKFTRALTTICCSESRFNIVRLALTLNTNGY
jgi:hypothetical protein